MPHTVQRYLVSVGLCMMCAHRSLMRGVTGVLATADRWTRSAHVSCCAR